MKNRVEFLEILKNLEIENGVLGLCQRVHDVTVGASPSVKIDELYRFSEALNFAITNWEMPETQYDVAVKNLVFATRTDLGYTIDSTMQHSYCGCS